MNTWLDTETKAILHPASPDKHAPPDTGTFALVLLKKGDDPRHLLQALTKTPGVHDEKAGSLVSQACPSQVAILSIADSLLGQFELICCDSISVFINYEVVLSSAPGYLDNLYSQLLKSSEFEQVKVSVSKIPDTDIGIRFREQFFGEGNQLVRDHIAGGLSISMMRKKARILTHWAEKIGAEAAII